MSNSSISGLVQEWIANSAGGTSPSSGSDESVVNASEPLSSATESHETEVRAENSTLEELLPESGDTPRNSADQSSQKTTGKQQTSPKEVITVTDDKGRRKVEVDLGNKDEVRKYVQMAYGARKWQAERDQAIQARKQLHTEYSELKQNWDQLEQAFQRGPEALFDLLTGRRGAFGEHIQKQVERAEFLRKASPEEVEALQAKEQAAQHQKELARIREENEKFKKDINEQRETAELRSLESRVNPVFEKYRFADKLGNPDDESLFDDMLWNSALKRLEPYEEQGLDLTPELIEREFRSVASAVRRRIGSQAEKRATRVVEQKKQEATENVQSKVMSGYRTGGVVKEARDLIQKNDLTGLLKNWGKYGGVFRK